MVLLPKEGEEAGDPSAYRPLCLLDEAGKILERIIAGRLVQLLSQEEWGLDDDQFGFREGRSTIDAICRLRALSDKIIGEGGVVLAVSLEIVNAFNILPWGWIGRGLDQHRVPRYLKTIIREYFRDRRLVFRDQEGSLSGREVYCGVP